MSYSIRDAFKSLEEIDDDIITSSNKQVETKHVVKLSQSQVKLNEDKKSKIRPTNRHLLESSYNLNDDESIEEAKEVLDNNEKQENDSVEMIVDVNAESEEELKDSYIGNIIIECPVCKTKIYKTREELTIDGQKDEENISLDDATVNVGEACPHCKQEEGFVVIGKIAPVDADVNKDDETTSSEDSNLEDSTEDEEEVNDDENVESEVNSEESEGDEEEVEDEEKDKPSKSFSLLDAGEEDDEDKKEPKVESVEHLVISKPLVESDNTLDVNITTIDNKSFDNLVEKYLREVYDNIDNYTTTNTQVFDDESKLVLEGVIKFKSGKAHSTKFIFEANEITKHKLIKFKGINETFSKSKRAFTLHAQLNESTLVSKHLTYDYLAKSLNESKSTKIYGRVSNLERVK